MTQATLVEQLVSSGRYQNASEVLREELHLMEQHEAEDAHRLEALRDHIMYSGPGGMSLMERSAS